MSLWRLSWQELKRRPGRTFLTFLSVVIGVAAVISVSMAVIAARTAFSEMSKVLAGEADLRIEARGGGNFPQEIVRTLEAIPDIKEVQPMLSDFSTMYTGSARIRLPVFGIPRARPGNTQRVNDFELVEGRFFQENGEVMLDQGIAKGQDLKIGDEVKFLTRSGLITQKIVGVLKPVTSSAFESGSAAYWKLDDLQRATHSRGKISYAFVVLNSDTDEVEAQERIRAAIPPEIDMIPSGKQSGQALDLRIMIEAGLGFAAALSVLAMGFVILNTFLMSVSERTKSIAILRVLGASQRHIRTMLLIEGAAIGLAGAVFGLLGGYGIAILMVKGISYGMQINLSAPVLSIPWGIFSILFGIVIVLASILYPANRAMAITPLQGMRGEVTMGNSKRWPKLMIAIGLTQLVVGLALVILQTQLKLVFQVGVVGGVFMLVSVVFLFPPLIAPTVSLLAACASAFSNFLPDLVKKELLRHSTRTRLTWAILFVSISGTFALGNVLLDVIDDVHDWLDKTLHCDFVLRSNLPGMASHGSSGMPLELKEKIVQIKGVSRVAAIRFFTVQGSGRGMVAIGRQFKDEPSVPLDVRAGAQGAELKAKLLGGDVVLGAIAAQQMGLAPGDKLSIEFAGVKHDFNIAATIAAYAMGGMTVVLDYDVAKSVYGVDGADVFLIDGTFDKAEPPVEQLRKMAAENGATLQDYQDFSRMIDGMLSGVTASLWVVLGLGFSIALFGVVNTLTMNVLEQTQELGLLRVVGMTQLRVHWLILGQALVHGCTALLPGIAVGYLVAQLLRSTSLLMLGKEAELSNRPVTALLFATGVIVLVLIAAAWPARRAAKIPMLAAIRRQ